MPGSELTIRDEIRGKFNQDMWLDLDEPSFSPHNFVMTQVYKLINKIFEFSYNRRVPGAQIDLAWDKYELFES